MSRFVFKSFLNTISEYKQSTSNPMKYDCFESFWEYEWKIDLLSTRCKLLPVHIIFHNVQHPLSDCLLYFGGSFDVVVAFVISMPCNIWNILYDLACKLHLHYWLAMTKVKSKITLVPPIILRRFLLQRTAMMCNCASRIFFWNLNDFQTTKISQVWLSNIKTRH